MARKGGRYTKDPETGETTLVERTKPAPAKKVAGKPQSEAAADDTKAARKKGAAK